MEPGAGSGLARLSPLLDSISASEHDRQDQDEPSDDGQTETQTATEAGGMLLHGRGQPGRDPQSHGKPGQSMDPWQPNEEGR